MIGDDPGWRRVEGRPTEIQRGNDNRGGNRPIFQHCFINRLQHPAWLADADVDAAVGQLYRQPPQARRASPCATSTLHGAIYLYEGWFPQGHNGSLSQAEDLPKTKKKREKPLVLMVQNGGLCGLMMGSNLKRSPMKGK